MQYADVVVDGYTGNDGNKNDSSSEDANNWLVHTGNNGNTNGTSNEGVTVGTHNGNDGNKNNLSDSDNLNSNNNLSVLFLVPSGNNPIAPPFFKTSNADATAASSFLLLSTLMHPAALKNHATFLLSKYSFLAI